MMRTIQTKPMAAMPFVRAYLRASTNDQDAGRARADLEAFAADHGLEIASWYVENESGAKLQRPELFRLIEDARKGDLLLVEQVDRLSRLKADDWETLKADLARKHGVSEATLYNWKAKYGGMDVSDAKRLRALEDENRKLKKLLAESMLDQAALKELLTKKW